MADGRMPVPACDIVDLRRGVEDVPTVFGEGIPRPDVSAIDGAEAGTGPGDERARVAIYTRYSSPEPERARIERKVRMVTACMRETERMREVWHPDPARSRRPARDREGLVRLADGCRADMIGDIIIEDFDRL